MDSENYVRPVVFPPRENPVSFSSLTLEHVFFN
jgi:hypothetical protein